MIDIEDKTTGRYGKQRSAVQAAFDEQYDAYRAGTAATDVRIRCPLCLDRTGKADYRGSLSVSLESGFYQCFKCQARGRLGDFGGEWDYRDTEPVARDKPVVELPRDFEPLTEDWLGSYTGDDFARYAISRCHSWQAIYETGLGVAGNRLVVPVRDAENNLVGWVARSIPHRTPAWLPETKYVYNKGFRRELVLFNEAALQRSYDQFLLTGMPLVIVEGIFDALPHYPNAVACLGKPTKTQEAVLSNLRHPVVIALDGDAWEEGRALAERLFLRGVEAAWMRLAPGVDPGDFDPETFSALLKRIGSAPGQGFNINS